MFRGLLILLGLQKFVFQSDCNILAGLHLTIQFFKIDIPHHKIKMLWHTPSIHKYKY
jgi:hypothetical protein